MRAFEAEGRGDVGSGEREGTVDADEDDEEAEECGEFSARGEEEDGGVGEGGEADGRGEEGDESAGEGFAACG